MTYNKLVSELFKALLEAGLSSSAFCISGGFARDLHHGIAPNDVDIVIVPGVTGGFRPEVWMDQHDWSRIDAAMRRLAYVRDTAEFCDSSGPTTERWQDIVQYSHPNPDIPDVDFLVSAKASVNVLEVVQSNDFNINHYAILCANSLGDPVGPIYVGHTPAGVLRQTRDSAVTEERAKHIRDIADRLHWTIPVTPTKENTHE